jgi:hypothetical protein
MIETPRRPPAPDRGAELAGTAIGVLGSIALSLLLIPLREHTSNAVMALALVVPVLLGAVVGGRWSAGFSAAAATLCFNFFFTRPYLSLRIESSDDVETFVVLLVVAMITAEVGIRARAGGRAARESRDELDRLYRIADLSAHGGEADDVVAAVRGELIDLFGLDDCTFETGSTWTPLPSLGARGAFESAELVLRGSEFAMPTGGVELPVVGRGRIYGRLVLYASESTPAPIERRMVAVAIADELGITLASHASDTPSN